MPDVIRYEQARAVLADTVAERERARGEVARCDASVQSDLATLADLEQSGGWRGLTARIANFRFRRRGIAIIEDSMAKTRTERRIWSNALARAEAEADIIAERILFVERPAYATLASYVVGLKEIIRSAGQLRQAVRVALALSEPIPIPGPSYWFSGSIWSLVELMRQEAERPKELLAAQLKVIEAIRDLSSWVKRHESFCAECERTGNRLAVAPWRRCDFSRQDLKGRAVSLEAIQTLTEEIENEARTKAERACAAGRAAVERVLAGE